MYHLSRVNCQRWAVCCDIENYCCLQVIHQEWGNFQPYRDNESFVFCWSSVKILLGNWLNGICFWSLDYWVRIPNRSNFFFVVYQIDPKFFPPKKVVYQIDPKIFKWKKWYTKSIQKIARQKKWYTKSIQADTKSIQIFKDQIKYVLKFLFNPFLYSINIPDHKEVISNKTLQNSKKTRHVIFNPN